MNSTILHTGQKKVLIISNVPPLKDVGGGIRTIEILELFKSIGYSTSVFLIYPLEWGPLRNEWITSTIKEYGLSGIHYYPIKKRYLPELSLIKKLRKLQKDFDLIVFRFEEIAFKSGFYLLKKKIIIDYDDYSYFLAKSRREKFRNLFQLLFAKSIIFRSFILQKEHLSLFGSKSVYLPNLPLNIIFPAKGIIKKLSTLPSILFVGSRPEWLGDFLIKEWHHILQVIPFVKIFIITRDGHRIPDEVKSYPGLEILGDVDDLAVWYEKAWVSIVPSLHNYGTHIKILESIMYKTPVIANESAIRGYEEFNKREIIITTAADYEELRVKLISLLGDKSHIEYLGNKGYEIAQHKFSFSSLSAVLNNSLHYHK